MSWDPVFRFVKRIPRGRVLTYGVLAEVLGLPGGARSAGRAMAATPLGKGVPWHRVVGEHGKILITFFAVFHQCFASSFSLRRFRLVARCLIGCLLFLNCRRHPATALNPAAAFFSCSYGEKGPTMPPRVSF